MGILDYSWYMICGPIVLVMSFIFYGFLGIGVHPGICLIILSLIVSFVVSCIVQLTANRTTDVDKLFERWSKHIRDTFHGDERTLRLARLYKEIGYGNVVKHMLVPLVTIFLQIPIFSSAYIFISGVSVLQDVSFLCITNLGEPDALVHIGQTQINILPILMIVTNLAYITLWTIDSDWKNRICSYGLAIVFLILLYNSSSGLVLYWTCNQICSIVIYCIRNFLKTHTYKLPCLRVIKFDFNISRYGYVSLLLFWPLFCGLAVPLMYQCEEPSTAIYTLLNVHFVEQTLLPFCVYFGLFCFWPGLVYFMSGETTKYYMRNLTVWLSICGLLIWLISPSSDNGFVNAAVWIVLFIGIYIFLCGSTCIPTRIVSMICMSLCVTCVVISMFCIGKLVNEEIRQANTEQANHDFFYESDGSYRKLLRLSRTEKNVVVLFCDKLVSDYTDDVFDNDSDLQKSFDGFTYYPNTVSLAENTVSGSPAMFGGYEYTPWAINARDNETMSSKHNEAILSLARTFDNEGYRVTAANIPYAGSYAWDNDMSVYNSILGSVAIPSTQIYAADKTRDKNLDTQFYYDMITFELGIDRFLPKNMKDAGIFAIRRAFHCNELYGGHILTSYYSLNAMCDISEIDDGNGSFLILGNALAHDPFMVTEKDGTLDLEGNELLDTRGINNGSVWGSNLAVYKSLGKWFDYLREEGVYDNTRIIIVADHGANVGYDGIVKDDADVLDISTFHPALLVKDFDAHGWSQDESFMVNADMPYLATKDLLKNSVNLYTNTAYSKERIDDDGMIVLSGIDHEVRHQNETTFNMHGVDRLGIRWWYVHTDMRDVNNWKMISEDEAKRLIENESR